MTDTDFEILSRKQQNIMVLSFKTRFPNGTQTNFENNICAGSKKHTIREDKQNRWKKGNKIHASNGVRTKKYKCFYTADCTGVQQIHMIWKAKEGLTVFVNARQLDQTTTNKLIENDGLTPTQFLEWFGFDDSGDKEFRGKIIHWTDLRY